MTARNSSSIAIGCGCCLKGVCVCVCLRFPVAGEHTAREAPTLCSVFSRSLSSDTWWMTHKDMGGRGNIAQNVLVIFQASAGEGVSLRRVVSDL